MSKMFQIREEDLADLEHTLPELLDATYPSLTNRMRTQWRRVQEVLKNVRWNYGPPTEVKLVDEDGELPT